MMTRPDPEHPTVRLTNNHYRKREIVVTLHPWWMTLHLKGTRTRYRLLYLAAFHFAAKLEADRIRAERKAAGKQAHKRGRKGGLKQ